MRRALRLIGLVTVAVATVVLFLSPGLSLVRDLRDPALRGPGVPERAWRMHRDLAPRVQRWADERVASGAAATVPLYDVPTTEWPMFTAVFYLLATEQLQEAWMGGARRDEPEPLSYSRGAVDAAKRLILDPAHHTWVRTHWGDDYLHRENVFFRSLLIAGLTSHVSLTGDRSAVAMLRDQVETLARDLDRSERGLLHDYPDECYPIDVVVAIGFIRKADPVIGTDHGTFVSRSLRAFEGRLADDLGLVPYRMELPAYEQVQPSRGIGNSWVSIFAPDLWPDRAERWYARYDEAFWQDRVWASGFREFARARGDADWQFEVDAGPVLDGFGTSASAFGIGAARRNGRFDHAYVLSAQLSAASWTLAGGTSLAPRALSHAAAAPYLGESAILYFLTVQPADGVPIVTGGSLPGLVYFGLIVYFGVSAVVLFLVAWRLWRLVRALRRTQQERVTRRVVPL